MTNPDRIMEMLRSDERLRLISDLASALDARAFLVGGGLRDAVMGRSVRDFDFALDGAVEDLPREFASHIGGSFFWLDRERRQSRVVAARGEAAFTWDFAPVRGGDILADLALRDFTVNSLALPLVAGVSGLLDPLDGLSDIASGTIRACGAGTFEDDPLRLLRALRFAATFGFAIEERTWQEIGRKSSLLDRVAGERVRDEFFQILAEPGIGASLERLRLSGLLSRIVSCEKETGEIIRERISRAARIEEVLTGLQERFPCRRQRFADHLNRCVEGGVPIIALVKLGAFLCGDDAPDLIEATSDRLRLGSRARAELHTLCSCATPVNPLYEGERERRAYYRFFRDLAPAGPELLLLPLVEKRLEPELADRLLSFYFDDYRPTDSDLFLTGVQVMEIVGIQPGPELGRHLALLRQAESVGEVASEAEAREFIMKNRLTKQEPMG